MSVDGPRNVATNPNYRNAYYRARSRAMSRLVDAHRAHFKRLLKEERERAGLPYRRGTGARSSTAVR